MYLWWLVLVTLLGVTSRSFSSSSLSPWLLISVVDISVRSLDADDGRVLLSLSVPSPEVLSWSSPLGVEVATGWPDTAPFHNNIDIIYNHSKGTSNRVHKLWRKVCSPGLTGEPDRRRNSDLDRSLREMMKEILSVFAQFFRISTALFSITTYHKIQTCRESDVSVPTGVCWHTFHLKLQPD